MFITTKKHNEIVKTLLDEVQKLNERIQEMEKFLNEDVKQMAKEAGDKITAWEQFFNDTLEDMSSVLNMAEELMKRRQLVSDDPDVQNFVRIVAIAHDVVKNYIDSKSGNTTDGTDEGKQTK